MDTGSTSFQFHFVPKLVSTSALLLGSPYSLVHTLMVQGVSCLACVSQVSVWLYFCVHTPNVEPAYFNRDPLGIPQAERQFLVDWVFSSPESQCANLCSDEHKRTREGGLA